MTKSFNIIYNWLHISECLYLVSQIRNHSIIEGANLICIRILAQVLWLCYYIFQNVSLELFFDIFDFTLLQSLYYFNWKRLGTYVSRKKFFFNTTVTSRPQKRKYCTWTVSFWCAIVWTVIYFAIALMSLHCSNVLVIIWQ